MGRLPAVVNIARHGARLDAADSQWHLTSPTPYDTPLTYGGWIQSRALGARIAGLLETYHLSGQYEGAKNDSTNGEFHHDQLSPVSEDAPSSSSHTSGRESAQVSKKSREKARIIIHTSPYLRCVQTSIAISAGLAQYHGAPHHHAAVLPKAAHLHSASPRLKAIGASESPSLAAIPEPPEGKAGGPGAIRRDGLHFRRPLLRVDAFLGEWLNPDYYDMITPPPSSVMMVAGAKADLLRSGDYTDLAVQTGRKSSSGFPGGWGGEVGESSLSSMAGVAEALPRRDRLSIHSGPGASTSVRTGASSHKIRASHQTERSGYTPLIPTYAISTADPIPRGYVEHARDACIEVDYQWDSMREPQCWGTGGEYGEEWGAMHKRYRQAIQKMLSWYRDHNEESTAKKRQKNDAADAALGGGQEEDDGPETVIILVSHGAGCNAIIGGLTDRTVLLDVGMASLTTAVRIDAAQMSGSVESLSGDPTDPRNFLRRKSSVTIPVSEDYEIKLMASTDHLRIPANANHSPPLIHTQSFTAGSRRPRASARTNSMDDNFTLGEARHSTTSSAIGSIRRTTSSRSSSPMTSRQPIPTSPALSQFGGLWHRAPASDTTTDDEFHAGDDQMLKLGDSTADSRPGEKEWPVEVKVDVATPPTEPTTVTHSISTKPGVVRADIQRGLWGSSAVAEERKEKDESLKPKRRWTVHERAR